MEKSTEGSSDVVSGEVPQESREELATKKKASTDVISNEAPQESREELDATKTKASTGVITVEVPQESKEEPVATKKKASTGVTSDEVPRESKEELVATKKKASTGVYFSDIPKDVRVSEFKNKLRERDVKLVFVKWKAFKQSAIVFFEDELDVVIKNLDGLTLHDEVVKFEEIVPKVGSRDQVKKSPKIKRTSSDKVPPGREGAKKKFGKDSKDTDLDKSKKRTNRKEQRIKKREDFGGEFGIFVGKIPKGVTKEDLGQEFAKLEVPGPDYVDWVVKKGHAFAFWKEADSGLDLEVFTGIKVGGVTLQVELYDSNRAKIKGEKKIEEKVEEKETSKKIDNTDKKLRPEPDKKGGSKTDNESHNELKEQKLNDSKNSKDDESNDKIVNPKNTATKTKDVGNDKVKTTEATEQSPKSKSKMANGVKKTPTKSPETKAKSVKASGDTPSKTGNKPPGKTSTKSIAPPKSQEKSAKQAAGGATEGGKDNCSIS